MWTCPSCMAMASPPVGICPRRAEAAPAAAAWQHEHRNSTDIRQNTGRFVITLDIAPGVYPESEPSLRSHDGAPGGAARVGGRGCGGLQHEPRVPWWRKPMTDPEIVALRQKLAS